MTPHRAAATHFRKRLPIAFAAAIGICLLGVSPALLVHRMDSDRTGGFFYAGADREVWQGHVWNSFFFTAVLSKQYFAPPREEVEAFDAAIRAVLAEQHPEAPSIEVLCFPYLQGTMPSWFRGASGAELERMETEIGSDTRFDAAFGLPLRWCIAPYESFDGGHTYRPAARTWRIGGNWTLDRGALSVARTLPTRLRPTALLINVLTWWFLIASPWSLAVYCRSYRRARRGLCIACGYQIGAAGICPECGTCTLVSTRAQN